MELNMHDVKRGTSGAYIRASPNFAFVIPVISPDQVFPLYEVRPDNAAFNNVTGAVAKLRVLGDWDIQVIRHGEGRVLSDGAASAAASVICCAGKRRTVLPCCWQTHNSQSP
jgi:hypothetical protein